MMNPTNLIISFKPYSKVDMSISLACYFLRNGSYFKRKICPDLLILFPEQASLFLASTHTMKSSKSKLRKKIFNQATLDQNYHPSQKEKTRLKILYASINFQSHDNVMINLVAF